MCTGIKDSTKGRLKMHPIDERTGRNIKQQRMTTLILGICKFAIYILMVFPESKSLLLFK